ncbi:deoxynucleotidyltransferase terminal-interacting protein 2 isoform X2 [Erpetoichthys calabaricus]|uniref:deoxynucleotidyltransferase terminal-interacting protein 2 isoform X2 n=1 Tax=Erpetoichthys calabaricus TaxID=27687 RepID=UPI0010A07E54|nr:deoxynucleotidyltransferase terminal-interacting protein 2 isoform X2 [Erpetoichthys calabaricus]
MQTRDRPSGDGSNSSSSMVATRRGGRVECSDDVGNTESSQSTGSKRITRSSIARAECPSDAASEEEHREAEEKDSRSSIPSEVPSAAVGRLTRSRVSRSALQPEAVSEADISEAESCSSAVLPNRGPTEQRLTRSSARDRVRRPHNEDVEVSEAESCASSASTHGASRLLRSKVPQSQKRGDKPQVQDADVSDAESCSSVASGIASNVRTPRSRSLVPPAAAGKSQPEEAEVSEAESSCSSVSGLRSTRSRLSKASAPNKMDCKAIETSPVRPSSGPKEQSTSGSPVKASGVPVRLAQQPPSSPFLTRSLRSRAVPYFHPEDSDGNLSAAPGSPEKSASVSSQSPSRTRTVSRSRHSMSLKDRSVVTQAEPEPSAEESDGDQKSQSEESGVSEVKNGGQDINMTQSVEMQQEDPTSAEHEDMDKNGDPLKRGQSQDISIHPEDNCEDNSVIKPPLPESSSQQETEQGRRKSTPPQVIHLLLSSDEESDSEEEGCPDEDDLFIVESESRPAKPTSPPEASSTQQNDLFVIDTRPGFNLERKFYIETQDTASKSSEDEEEEDDDDDVVIQEEDVDESDDEFVDEEADEDAVDNDVLFKPKRPPPVTFSSNIDPGLSLKQFGGLYIHLDAEKQRKTPSVVQKTKEPKKKDELLQKSVITPDFEKKHVVPPYKESIRKLKQKRREERAKTTGDSWFNMKAPELTEDLKNDLRVLKMRSAMDPKRFYKKNDRDGFPKYFQVGTVVDNPIDFYHARIPKKQRKRTIVDELMADADFRSYNKKKFKEIMAEKAELAAGKKNRKKKKFHN